MVFNLLFTQFYKYEFYILHHIQRRLLQPKDMALCLYKINFFAFVIQHGVTYLSNQLWYLIQILFLREAILKLHVAQIVYIPDVSIISFKIQTIIDK